MDDEKQRIIQEGSEYRDLLIEDTEKVDPDLAHEARMGRIDIVSIRDRKPIWEYRDEEEWE